MKSPKNPPGLDGGRTAPVEASTFPVMELVGEEGIDVFSAPKTLPIIGAEAALGVGEIDGNCLSPCRGEVMTGAATFDAIPGCEGAAGNCHGIRLPETVSRIF